jgi:hypothetical protein
VQDILGLHSGGGLQHQAVETHLFISSQKSARNPLDEIRANQPTVGIVRIAVEKIGVPCRLELGAVATSQAGDAILIGVNHLRIGMARESLSEAAQCLRSKSITTLDQNHPGIRLSNLDGLIRIEKLVEARQLTGEAGTRKIKFAGMGSFSPKPGDKPDRPRNCSTGTLLGIRLGLLAFPEKRGQFLAVNPLVVTNEGPIASS